MTLLRVIFSRAKAPRREESTVVIVTQFSRGLHSFHNVIEFHDGNVKIHASETKAAMMTALLGAFDCNRSIISLANIPLRQGRLWFGVSFHFLRPLFLITRKFRILLNNGVTENVFSSMTLAFYELNRFLL